MKESQIEDWLRRQVSDMGGLCYKWTSPGNRGVPDRIVILPGGGVYFVELKTEQGRLSELQNWVQGELRKRGCTVYTVYGTDDAKALVERMRRGIRTA